MAVLNREEFFTRLHTRLGEDTSEDGISFLEDMTDTYNDMENRANGDGVNWEEKYKQLDESWRARYRHRFFNGGDKSVPDSIDSEKDSEEYNPDNIQVEDLFTEKEEK